MAPQMMSTEKYTSMISALDNEFARRFADFQKLDAEFDILSSPFTTDFEKAPDALQLELIDLQCDSTLKEKFQCESIDKFYASLNESKFANLRKMAMKLLVLFGSTYICEQTFSTMNINKTKLRSNLTDVHVQSLLRISTSDMQPEFKQLVDKFDRPQMSHWLQQLLKYITWNSLNTVFGLYGLCFKFKLKVYKFKVYIKYDLFPA